MTENLTNILSSIAQQPQRQDGTNAQLADLRVFANRLGLYDAADLIGQLLERPVERAQAKEAAQ
jgi:hypothetical protein